MRVTAPPAPYESWIVPAPAPVLHGSPASWSKEVIPWPGSPCGPVGPRAPGAPSAPSAPAGPVAPMRPCAPLGPADPVTPARPPGPVGPDGPVTFHDTNRSLGLQSAGPETRRSWPLFLFAHAESVFVPVAVLWLALSAYPAPAAPRSPAAARAIDRAPRHPSRARRLRAYIFNQQ